MTPIAILSGLALGVLIGTISGLTGIGGGAVLVPILVLFYGMTQHRAQGTAIATLLLPIGILAFWKYYRDGNVDLRLALLVAVGFAAGGWLGGTFAQHLSDVVLRRSFAVLLIVVAIRMLIK